MNLSHVASLDLPALAQLKSEGGMLARQFLQLKELVVKGHLVGRLEEGPCLSRGCFFFRRTRGRTATVHEVGLKSATFARRAFFCKAGVGCPRSNRC